jgi:uncharacterized lipoprotein YddW (UPF0748 family)/N-acetylmuramoyl-L-alanine amidase
MKRFLVSVLILAMTLSTIAMPAFASDTDADEMRGVWVATVYNIDYPARGTTNSDLLKAEAIEILDNVQEMGMNAVFLQVRPTADAFYDSKYFPWSKYLTGEQGVAPSDDFDPLTFWVEEAHERGIELHAWINPYRITKNGSGNVQDAWDGLTSDHIARKRKDLVVEFGANLYFNPSMPDVWNIVAAGVMEIVENYDVDGIHFDDYFYPSASFNDDQAYAIYGKEFSSKADFRRYSVTEMVRTVDDIINRINPDVSFGISPFGIWANKESNSLGSETRGNQSYYAHYADSRQWVKEGIIDYINPQIYWNIGFTIADYEKLVNWWTDVVSGTDVDLYIGHAAYKQGNDDPASAWYGDFEIFKQIMMNRKNDEVDGSVFFSYRSFKNRPTLMNNISAFYDHEAKPSSQVPTYSDGLTVTGPTGDIKTGYAGYYLFGISDPNTPLYINGQMITNRSDSGYFGTYQTLQIGKNTFTITQKGQTVTREIERTQSTWAPTAVSEAKIVPTSALPKGLEIWSVKDVIKLQCYAPIGAQVTVTVDGKTYPMNPATNLDYEDVIYNTSYEYYLDAGVNPAGVETRSLGDIVYRMSYKGINDSVKAKGSIVMISEETNIMAQVTSLYTDTHFNSQGSGGSDYILSKGMADEMTAMVGNHYRLKSGMWVEKSDVKIVTMPDNQSTGVEEATYQTGGQWETVKLKINGEAAAKASFSGEYLSLQVFNTTDNAALTLPGSALFDQVNIDGDFYHLHLKDGMAISGYKVDKTEDGIQLSIRKQSVSTSSYKPLKGKTILVDPGHGGRDSGALGILGTAMSEKMINLSTAGYLKEELEGYGATVVMTRATDTYVSLQERLRESYTLTPDLFISIHVNSISPDRDIDKVQGFSIYLNEELAKPVAQAIHDEVIVDLNRVSRGVKTNNFYVVRGTWTPSILLEMGFMVNPEEFDLLDDAAGQRTIATEIAEGIVKYFQ